MDCRATSGSQIFQVEVKAGNTSRLKSLMLFMPEYGCLDGVWISQQSFSYFD